MIHLSTMIVWAPFRAPDRRSARRNAHGLRCRYAPSAPRRPRAEPTAAKPHRVFWVRSVSSFRAKDSNKKGPFKTALQKYPKMGIYVVSTYPDAGRRTMRRRHPADRAPQMLMSRISKWIVPAGTSTSTRSPFLCPSNALAMGVPIASLPSRKLASCSATIV